MKFSKIHLSLFALILVSSIAKADVRKVNGACLLNKTSPDHTFAGRNIVNGIGRFDFENSIFKFSYIDSDGKVKEMTSPKLNINPNDGDMALSGPQWMAKNNNTYYVISNRLKIIIDNCTQ